MRLFRRKGVAFRLFLVMCVCLGASSLPIAIVSMKSYATYQQTVAEYNASKFLGELAIVANCCFLDGNGVTEASKTSLVNSIKNIEKYYSLITANTSDAYRKNSRGKVLFSKDMLMSMPAARDKNVLIVEMCSYVAIRSGMYNDAYVDTHSLSEASAAMLPRIYAGYFEINRILAEWSNDRKNFVDLSYLAANLKDDSKELINSLKRISTTSSDQINYSVLLGGLNQFNVSAEELDVALNAAWREDDFDLQSIKMLLSANEHCAGEIWQAATQVLGESLKVRDAQLKREALGYALYYGAILLFCILFSCLVIFSIRSALRRTVAALKLALGGVLSESAQMCEKNSFECHDEISKIDSSLDNLIRMFSKTLSDVKDLASASEGIEIAADSFAKRQRPHYESMSAAIEQVQANNASESAHFDALLTRLSTLRGNAGRIGEEIYSYTNTLNGQSVQVMSENEAAKSFSESIVNTRGFVEKLDGIAKTYSEIAERANLLALNLSIEVERAGLKGTGIEALVSEIRSLSTRTSVSALDIESIRIAIGAKLGVSFDDAEKFSDAANAHIIALDNLADSLRKSAARLSSFAVVPRGDAVENSREDIAFALASLRKNMEGANGVLAEFSHSTRKSLEEFARILETISFYK